MKLMIKILISMGFIVYVSANLDYVQLKHSASLISVKTFILGFILVFIQNLVFAYRWKEVHNLIRVPMPLWLSIKLSWLSMFFSQFVPGGGVGADAIRAWKLYKYGYTPKVAMTSVIIDRGMALFSLFLMTLIPTCFFVTDIPMSVKKTVATTSILGALGAVLVWVVWRTNKLRLWHITRPIQSLLSEIFNSLAEWQKSISIFWLSVFLHLVTVCVFYLLAQDLNNPTAFWEYLILTPPVIIATVLPISVAGWGVREGVTVFLFSLIGFSVAESTIMSVILGIYGLLAALPGGVVWILDKK